MLSVAGEKEVFLYVFILFIIYFNLYFKLTYKTHVSRQHAYSSIHNKNRKIKIRRPKKEIVFFRNMYNYFKMCSLNISSYNIVTYFFSHEFILNISLFFFTLLRLVYRPTQFDYIVCGIKLVYICFIIIIVVVIITIILTF